MISMDFKTFLERNFKSFEVYDDGYDEGYDYELYVVKNSVNILYIGISQVGIWGRWFGHFGRMQRSYDGLWNPTDSVSQEIVENLPASLDWTIELWTVKDLSLFFEDNNPLRLSNPRAIKYYEPRMIQKLKPTLNSIYN
jgi:hypothetical protein